MHTYCCGSLKVGGSNRCDGSSVTTIGMSLKSPFRMNSSISAHTFGRCWAMGSRTPCPPRSAMIVRLLGKYGAISNVFSTGVLMSQFPCAKTTGMLQSSEVRKSSPTSALGQMSAVAR